MKVWIQVPRLSTNCICGSRFWRIFMGAKVGTDMQAHRDGMRAAGNVAGPRSRTGKPKKRLLVQATCSSAYLCAHDEKELRGFEDRSVTGRPYRPSAPLGPAVGLPAGPLRRPGAGDGRLRVKGGAVRRGGRLRARTRGSRGEPHRPRRGDGGPAPGRRPGGPVLPRSPSRTPLRPRH